MANATDVTIPVQGKNYHLAHDKVKVAELNPTLDAVLDRAAYIHSLLFGKPLVVTSGNDGQHVPGSKHYRNAAADVRTRDVLLVEQFVFLNLFSYMCFQAGCSVFDQRRKRGEPHYHVELA